MWALMSSDVRLTGRKSQYCWLYMGLNVLRCWTDREKITVFLMMWTLMSSVVGLTCWGEKHSIADDVGLNVLRCWADMLGRKNTALLMMWAWMSSDVELTCVLLLGTKTQHCQEVLSFILTEDVCFSHKNKYFMHFCFVLSMYRHSDCVALACFTLILLLTVIYGLVLIVPNSH